jgi:hypothetical protein
MYATPPILAITSVHQRSELLVKALSDSNTGISTEKISLSAWIVTIRANVGPSVAYA